MTGCNPVVSDLGSSNLSTYTMQIYYRRSQCPYCNTIEITTNLNSYPVNCNRDGSEIFYDYFRTREGAEQNDMQDLRNKPIPVIPRRWLTNSPQVKALVTDGQT